MFQIIIQIGEKLEKTVRINCLFYSTSNKIRDVYRQILQSTIPQQGKGVGLWIYSFNNQYFSQINNIPGDCLICMLENTNVLLFLCGSLGVEKIAILLSKLFSF